MVSPLDFGFGNCLIIGYFIIFEIIGYLGNFGAYCAIKSFMTFAHLQSIISPYLENPSTFNTYITNVIISNSTNILNF